MCVACKEAVCDTACMHVRTRSRMCGSSYARGTHWACALGSKERGCRQQSTPSCVQPPVAHGAYPSNSVHQSGACGRCFMNAVHGLPPLGAPQWKIAPALAAGNCCILKVWCLPQQQTRRKEGVVLVVVVVVGGWEGGCCVGVDTGTGVGREMRGQVRGPGLCMWRAVAESTRAMDGTCCAQSHPWPLLALVGGLLHSVPPPVTRPCGGALLSLC